MTSDNEMVPRRWWLRSGRRRAGFRWPIGNEDISAQASIRLFAHFAAVLLVGARPQGDDRPRLRLEISSCVANGQADRFVVDRQRGGRHTLLAFQQHAVDHGHIQR